MSKAKPVVARALRVMLLCGVANVAGPALAQTTQQGDALEEIVITAQRKEESLQRVPVAVTAFTSDSIGVLRIQNTRDLDALAPGLSIQQTPGGSLGVYYGLRGDAGSASYAGQGAPVATYLDGVYQGSNVGVLFDVADIERIEVLRGPQGTLFGRNSTGGAISVITRDPSGEFQAHQELTYGNYDQFRSKTRVDLPAWGALSFSGTFLHIQRQGDIRNLGAGTEWNYGPATDNHVGILTSPSYLGDNNENSIGTTALFKTDDVRIAYKFDYTRKYYTEAGQGLVGFANGSAASGLGQLIYSLQPPALQTPITKSRPDAVNNAFTTPGTLNENGHNLTASWTVNPDITFKNILAYRFAHDVETSNVDGFGFAGIALPNVAPGYNLVQALGGPAGSVLGTLIGVSTDSRFHQFSEEPQVNITTRWVDLTAGLLYYKESAASVPFLNDAGNGPLNGLFFSQPITPGQPIVLYNQGYLPSVVNSTSKAVYAQGSIHVLDNVDLVLGARETWDHKSGDDALDQPGTALPILYKADKPTWVAGVNYRPTDETLTYAKFSTGFISGGLLGGQVYNPEFVKSYELGAKSDFLNHRARANVALYQADYNGLQFPQTEGGHNLILNYSSARARGVELEGSFIPFDGWTLSGNLSFLDFRVAPAALSVAQGLSTQPYAVVSQSRPKWTSEMSIQYETPNPVVLNSRFLVHVDGTFKSQYFGASRGYDDNGDGVFSPADPTYGEITTPKVYLLNARVALAEIPMGPVKGQVALWGRNLTNNAAPQFITYLSFAYTESFQYARTFGIDLIFNY